MDLTPDALRETTFRGALRGYNVDDVDEFVEKVAAGMAELLDQLRLASERAVAAERRAKEVTTSDDAMRRTLGHAQKLAEAVLAEARQEAARLNEEALQAGAQLRASVKEEVGAERVATEAARADAEKVRSEVRAVRAQQVAEADVHRQAALKEIEAERAVARRQLEGLVANAAARIDVDLLAEVDRLHGVREALQLDVAILTSWMHDQRDSVRTVLVETLAAVDRAAPADDPPPVSDVDTSVRLAGLPVPNQAAPVPPLAVTAPAPPPPPPAEPRPDPAPTAEPGLDGLGDTTFPDLSDEEFLAELKKAADGGDDSLFGPPDHEHPS